MTPFNYIKPSTAEEIVATLARGSARVLAGGTDLLPQLSEGRRTVATVVDLKAVPEMTRLARAADGTWSIGAAVTIGALGRDLRFAHEHQGLLAAARLIGSLQIQNRASLGGNLCNGAPSADAVPLLYCLRASAEIAGRAGRRHVPVADLVTAPGRTSLATDDVLVALHLPPLPHRGAARYLRFTPRREMDIAVAGSAAVLSLDGQGAIADACITLASVAPTPLVVDRAAATLRGQVPSRDLFERAAALAAADCKPISDSRASADYRRHLVGVLTHRVLVACLHDLGASLP